MPRLLVFAPCETVLISQGESASLIVILHQLKLGGQVPNPVPANAAAPMKWNVFAQWEIAENEIGVEFEERFELVNSDGVPTGWMGMIQFTPEAEKPIQRVIVSMTSFPILPAGHYRITTYLRRVGEEAWSSFGEGYPLQLFYQTANETE